MRAALLTLAAAGLLCFVKVHAQPDVLGIADERKRLENELASTQKLLEQAEIDRIKLGKDLDTERDKQTRFFDRWFKDYVAQAVLDFILYQKSSVNYYQICAAGNVVQGFESYVPTLWKPTFCGRIGRYTGTQCLDLNTPGCQSDGSWLTNEEAMRWTHVTRGNSIDPRGLCLSHEYFVRDENLPRIESAGGDCVRAIEHLEASVALYVRAKNKASELRSRRTEMETRLKQLGGVKPGGRKVRG